MWAPCGSTLKQAGMTKSSPGEPADPIVGVRKWGYPFTVQRRTARAITLHMRVIRIDCPAGPPDSPPVYSPLSITEDRWVACVRGRDLHLHDLLRPDAATPALRIELGANHAIVAGALLTFDELHGFRRFVWREEAWTQVARFALAESGVWPTSLVLSPSGLRICVELPPAAGRRSSRVALLDATDGSVIAMFDQELSARASFAWLHGREVLFLSAPNYMGVLLLDAGSGSVLRSFVPTTGWDFCHTNYDLSPDGERLVVFGCVWAAPYEVRLYDARPWTAGFPASEGSFPLPLLFVQGEDLGCETVLPTRFMPTRDGLLSVVSLVTPADLPEPGSEDARDLDAAVTLAGLVEAVRAIAPARAILLRRIDPGSGSVVGWTIAPVPMTREAHVHLLSEHRVILADQSVCIFDGLTGTIRELAAFDTGDAWLETAVTSDGSALVVRVVVRASAG